MARFTKNTRTITVPTNANVRAIPVFESTREARQFTSFNIMMEVNLIPGETPEQSLDLSYPFKITSTPIEVNLTDTITQISTQFISDALDNYIDENRELKTLLNLGDDNQVVIINQRYGPQDQTEVDTLQVKLLKPLPDNVGLGDTAFISREVANTLIHSVKVKFAPEMDNTP